MSHFFEFNDPNVVFVIGVYEMLYTTRGLLTCLESAEDKAIVESIHDDISTLWDDIKLKPKPLPKDKIKDLYKRLREFGSVYAERKNKKQREE